MLPEQYEELETIIARLRSGRMTRRTFVEKALALGVASSMMVSLLEACSTGTIVLFWESEHDAGNTYISLVRSYNEGQGQKDGVYIHYTNGPSDSNLQHDSMKNALLAGTAADILAMDIIWLPEFYTWLKPIDEHQWPRSERTRYLPGPLEGCTFEGQLWAVPFRVDVGLLYYRTDIGATPPATWEDLARMAEGFQSSAKTRYGYVWQGAPYEGLVCSFVEVLYGYGGSIFAPNNPRVVTVTSPQAVQALTEMVNWMDRASPHAVLTYKEEDARAVWQQSYAAFMRNWPYAYSLSLGKGLDSSQVINGFDICALPSGGNNPVGHACIGGWQMGINKQSAHPDAAWKFLQYMLGQQRFAALNGSFAVTLKSVYEDSEVPRQNLLFRKLGPILQNARPRPASPKYPEMSAAIQTYLSQALNKKSSPAQALSDLQDALQRIVSSQ